MNCLQDHNQRNINVIIFVTLMRCLFASSACVTTSNRFHQEPDDTFVVAGESMSFTCIVSSYCRDTDRIEWRIEPTLYQTMQVDTCNADGHQMESRLHVLNVGEIDQYFTCILHTLQENGDGDPICISSKRAKMTVRYFPGADELTCQPAGEVELRLGQIMPISCEVPRSKPAVDLSWRVDPHAKLMFPPALDTGFQRTLRYDLQMEQELDHRTLFCEVTSPFAFPSRKLECSIGPIRLLRPPQVVVDPQQGEISSFHPLILVCMTSGYPDASVYQWSCSPPNILGGCNATSKTTTFSVPRLTDTDKRLSHDKTIVVTCSATNSEGTTSNVARVSFISGSTLILDDYLQSVNGCLSISIIEVNSSWSIGVQCSLDPRCSREDSVYFKWSVDGYEITNNENWAITSSTYVSSLKFPANVKNFVPQNATCKAKCPHFVYEAHIDIFLSLDLDDAQVTTPSKNGVQSISTKGADQISTNKMARLLSVISSSGINQGDDPNYNEQLVSQGTHGGLNESETKISMWKIVTIAVSGVLAFVILTVCFIALCAIVLFRYFNHKTKAYSPSVAESPVEAEHGTLKHYKETSFESNEPIYEVPKMPTEPEHVPKTYDDCTNSPAHTHHTYAIGIERFERSSLSTVSESSWSSSNSTYISPS
ncbi:uncharacterized protein [Diadema setosum]|uniref:uncharacterized protein n=1 Tax=Diadema setosum TaxID=31175 RepID=UPI003B3AF105